MMNKRLAKLQKELDISDTHNMPSTDIILKNVNNKINVSPEERKIYMKRKYLKITSIAAVICALAVTTAFAADSISGKIGEIISSDLTPQDNIIKAENSQLLTELITSLGEPDSEIFFRYYYCNEKIKTISKAMNISLSTVKTKLYRGKQKLKNTIIKRRANDE